MSDISKDNENKKNSDWDDWCELYEYFKKEILLYPPELKLPQFVILRLKGLAEGKFMSNKKVKPMANYDYKIITLTLKLSKSKINDYLARNKNNFTNETHKINGIFVIVESEINNVVMRINSAKKSEDKIENLELKHQISETAKYTKKDKKKSNKNTENLW